MVEPSVEQDIFQSLESVVAGPVILIAANWRGEYAVDLDEGALRVFYEFLEELCGSGPGAHGEAPVCIVLAMRGGLPTFADGVVRALRGWGGDYRVFIPCPVDGAGGIIAMAAREIVIHPFGGIGPVDRGPIVQPGGPLSLEALEALNTFPSAMIAPMMKGRSERKRLARLATAAQLRRVSQSLARRVGGMASLDEGTIEALFSVSIGEGTALGAEDLATLGLPARACAGEEAEALWRVFRHYEGELQMLDEPAPRYVSSDEWIDEVEFAPAVDVPAAVIALRGKEAFFELDTGSPDPDAERLRGRWRWTT